MPRMIRAARIPGQIGECTPVGNWCHQRCSLRWSVVKPLASPFDNLKVGKMLSMNWLPFRPAVCGQFEANVQVTSTSVCALGNTTPGAGQLFQQTAHGTGM